MKPSKSREIRLRIARGSEGANNAQLIRLHVPCKPAAAVKAAATKFKIKGAKARALVLCTLSGMPIDTVALTARLQPMQELLLLRISDVPRVDEGSAAAATVPPPALPDELASLIFSFIPVQTTDYALLPLAATSKHWNMQVVARFGVYGDGACCLGRWFWEEFLDVRSKRNGVWVRYQPETEWCIEDAFRRGAAQATMEFHEAQVATRSRKGGDKGKKRLGLIDYRRTPMAQLNMSRKGRAISVMRVPRVLGTQGAVADPIAVVGAADISCAGSGGV